MADKVHVGPKNRFKPYWDKSGLSSKAVKESAEEVSYLSEEVISFEDQQYVAENFSDSL